MPPPAPSPSPSRPHDLLRLEPVPELLRRARAELTGTHFRSGPIRLSRAPGRLDVMGGIADYTGSLVCEGTLDRAAAVALAAREDREVHVFSLNLLDEGRPHHFHSSLDTLREDLRRSDQKWAGYLAGCLLVLRDEGLTDVGSPAFRGLDIALYSTVPLGAGVSSSAAIEVATMMNLRDHFGLSEELDPMRLAALCQRVENQIVAAPCGIMDQATSCAGRAGALLKLLCQPHELQGFLELAQGIHVLGINTNVKHSVGGGQYGKTRCAAFMGHRMILSKMEDMGRAANMRLVADPMHGYLANLALDDYKKFFRQYLPQQMSGREFIAKFGQTIDTATTVDSDTQYGVLGATDHHVFEAHRVRNFVEFLEEAAKLPPDSQERGFLLDKAGHLMYASHISYTRDALLGAPEADLLVELVRKNERAGLYGAKITGGGQGGTVAVLANDTRGATDALHQIAKNYQSETGQTPGIFWGTSPGAWDVGTALA